MNEKNHNRLHEFRQLKKEIPGSHEHLIVGMGVALFTICVRALLGELNTHTELY